MTPYQVACIWSCLEMQKHNLDFAVKHQDDKMLAVILKELNLLTEKLLTKKG